MLIKPFRALYVDPAHAEYIVSPPYDVVSKADVLRLVATERCQFLRVTCPDAFAEQANAYLSGRKAMLTLTELGSLVRAQQLGFWLYELTQGSYSQVGVVGLASVAGYVQQRILKHEQTRPEKEDDRTKHITTLAAQTGPVMLTHQHSEALAARIGSMQQVAPTIAVTGYDGIWHRLWQIVEPVAVAELSALLNELDYLYIADGHHRSAAAARVACSSEFVDLPAAQYFLSVLFSARQTTILAYHRYLKQLADFSRGQMFAALDSSFDIKPLAQARLPECPHEIIVYCDSAWWSLMLITSVQQQHVDLLPVELLSDLILKPIYSITDQRSDDRVGFLGGLDSLTGLQQQVDVYGAQVAFALYPTAIEQLFARVQQQQMMPPKSTWFEPKLADGLLVHQLDQVAV